MVFGSYGSAMAMSFVSRNVIADAEQMANRRRIIIGRGYRCSEKRVKVLERCPVSRKKTCAPSRSGELCPVSGKHGDKSAGAGDGRTADPFGALNGLGGLPPGPESISHDIAANPAKTSQRGQKNTNRGRVDIIRQTAGRGGRGVTVARNFTGISLAEKQELAKKLQKACGVGGTVKDGCIEIQGDKREEMKRILTEAGFRPVFAGG